jgi:hypothetical protein
LDNSKSRIVKEEEAEIDRDIDELLEPPPSSRDCSSPLTPVEEDSYIEPGQEEEEEVEEEEVNELLVED